MGWIYQAGAEHPDRLATGECTDSNPGIKRFLDRDASASAAGGREFHIDEYYPNFPNSLELAGQSNPAGDPGTKQLLDRDAAASDTDGLELHKDLHDSTTAIPGK